MSKLNGQRTRNHCDCGQPATIMLCNAKVCQRCYELDRRRAAPPEKPDDWKLAYQYTNDDVDIACTRYLKRKGLWNSKGFQRMSYGTVECGVQAILARL